MGSVRNGCWQTVPVTLTGFKSGKCSKRRRFVLATHRSDHLFPISFISLREDAQALEHEKLKLAQQALADEQAHKQRLEMIEIRRKETALEKTFEREERSLRIKDEQMRALVYRKGHEHMPAVNLTLTPGGRTAMAHKAQRRYYAPTVKEANVKSKDRPQETRVALSRDFTTAAAPPDESKTDNSKGPDKTYRVNRGKRDGGRKR